MLIASFDDGTVAGVFDRTKNTPRANEMGEIGKANLVCRFSLQRTSRQV